MRAADVKGTTCCCEEPQDATQDSFPSAACASSLGSAACNVVLPLQFVVEVLDLDLYGQRYTVEHDCDVDFQQTALHGLSQGGREPKCDRADGVTDARNTTVGELRRRCLPLSRPASNRANSSRGLL